MPNYFIPVCFKCYCRLDGYDRYKKYSKYFHSNFLSSCTTGTQKGAGPCATARKRVEVPLIYRLGELPLA